MTQHAHNSITYSMRSAQQIMTDGLRNLEQEIKSVAVTKHKVGKQKGLDTLCTTLSKEAWLTQVHVWTTLICAAMVLKTLLLNQPSFTQFEII